MTPQGVYARLSVSVRLDYGYLSFSRAAPFAVFDHWSEIYCRPDFPRTHLHAGVVRDQLNGVIEIPGLDNQQASEDFCRFGERTVRHYNLAVLEPQRLGVVWAAEPFTSGPVTFPLQLLIVGKARVDHVGLFGLRVGSPLLHI